MVETKYYDKALNILAPRIGGIQTFIKYNNYSDEFYNKNRMNFPFSDEGNQRFHATQDKAFLCDVLNEYKIDK